MSSRECRWFVPPRRGARRALHQAVTEQLSLWAESRRPIAYRWPTTTAPNETFDQLAALEAKLALPGAINELNLARLRCGRATLTVLHPRAADEIRKHAPALRVRSAEPRAARRDNARLLFR